MENTLLNLVSDFALEDKKFSYKSCCWWLDHSSALTNEPH